MLFSAMTLAGLVDVGLFVWFMGTVKYGGLRCALRLPSQLLPCPSKETGCILLNSLAKTLVVLERWAHSISGSVQ